MFDQSDLPPGMADKEKHRKLLEVVELLHGMSVADAEHLLMTVRNLIKVGSYVDATGPVHKSVVAEFNAAFGEDLSAPVKQ